MIHLYFGGGKGKTTAAMGLALRTAGRGGGVVIAQFLKGADSGERAALARLPGAALLEVPERVKFTFQMTRAEREAEARRSLSLLERAAALARKPGCGLLVLDEALDAVNAGLLPLPALLEALDQLPPETEAVLTGRDPLPQLLERADYITEMVKVRHPFDRGVSARPGVEF